MDDGTRDVVIINSTRHDGAVARKTSAVKRLRVTLMRLTDAMQRLSPPL